MSNQGISDAVFQDCVKITETYDKLRKLNLQGVRKESDRDMADFWDEKVIEGLNYIKQNNFETDE